MRNFLKIAQGVNVVPLLLALYRHPDLWDADRIRQTYRGDSPHREVSDILVRFSDTNDANVGDELLCEWCQCAHVLSSAKDIAFAVMATVKGEVLGRIMVTRLAPGRQIYRHADVLGKYANFYTRYLIPLQSDAGCVFQCADESLQMNPGEVYWFNGHQMHSVINNSSRDRLTLIVDVRQ